MPAVITSSNPAANAAATSSLPVPGASSTTGTMAWKASPLRVRQSLQ